MSAANKWILTVFNADSACIKKILFVDIILFQNIRWYDLKCFLCLTAKLPFKLVFLMEIAESLYVVKYQPSQGNQHEDDEWHGHEQHRCTFFIKTVRAHCLICCPIPKWALFCNHGLVEVPFIWRNAVEEGGGWFKPAKLSLAMRSFC